MITIRKSDFKRFFLIKRHADNGIFKIFHVLTLSHDQENIGCPSAFKIFSFQHAAIINLNAISFHNRPIYCLILHMLFAYHFNSFINFIGANCRHRLFYIDLSKITKNNLWKNLKFGVEYQFGGILIIAIVLLDFITWKAHNLQILLFDSFGKFALQKISNDLLLHLRTVSL